jgi:hypothetical protein
VEAVGRKFDRPLTVVWDVVSQARILAVLASATLLLCPTAAAAASSASFDDPIGDSLNFAPDLGRTTITMGDDEAITVDTRIIPRPPAYWGGCAYYVGFPPFQTCVQADMNVTWYLDHTGGSGSVADGGADAKVVVIPRRGQTFLESSRWDSANGKFSAGAEPAYGEDSGGAHWTLRLTDLGVPRPSTLRLRVVSLYKSYNGLGELLNYSDTAGPGSIAIPPTAGQGNSAGSRPCKRATGRANLLQRRLRVAKRSAAKGKGKARHRLKALRSKRNRALKKMKRACGGPVTGDPPSSAPPGCHLVTKPVLKQEGVGIFAKWVIQPEVVVECEK